VYGSSDRELCRTEGLRQLGEAATFLRGGSKGISPYSATNEKSHLLLPQEGGCREKRFDPDHLLSEKKENERR